MTIGRQVLCFAGTTLAVEYEAECASIVDFLYHLAPRCPDASGPSDATYRLTTEEDGEQRCLYRDEKLIFRGTSWGRLAEILLGDSCRTLADHSHDGLMFHAAAVAWRGRGVVLPGAIGAGKSTLAAWLVAKGSDYLTDELVFVPAGSILVQAFPRPLNLKPPSLSVLRAHIDRSEARNRIVSSGASDMVPPNLLNAESRAHDVDMALLIFPKYQADAIPQLKRLPGAQAGLTLMECLVNARNLTHHGFPEIARLARRVPAYRLTYGDFDQIAEPITELLTSIST